MPIINKCITTRSEVIKLSLLPNNSVIYATKQHGIRAFNIDNCETNLNLNPKQFKQKSKIALSSDGKYIAIANKQTIYVIYIPTRKLIKTIKTDEEEIIYITFDPQMNYIITSTKNGRVLQYKHTHSSLLSRIFSLQPPLSALAFYEELIAATGKDKTITITSLNALSYRQTLRTNTTNTTALCFLDKKKIISANKDGVVFIHTLNTTTQPQRIETTLQNIKHIIPMSNPRYLLLGSDETFISVIDIEKKRLLHHTYVQLESALVDMVLTKDEYLIVALENRKILKLELPSRKRVLQYMKEERLPEAFFLIDREPMLKNTLEHQKLEQRYQQIIAEAVQALSNNNKELAKQLTDPFKYLSSKSIEIAELFRAFEKFTRFQALFLEKKYALAYAMSSKYPAFQYTTQYKKMEKAWQETFADAQRQMVLGRADVAKEILNQYMTTITKRSLIKFVLNHNQEFLEFLKAIEKKEYKKVYSFTKKNKLFRQVPTFKKMEENIEKKLQLAKEYIYRSEIDQALKEIENFETIPHLQEEIKALHIQCKHLQELQHSYKKDDFLQCYILIDTYDDLANIELTKLLEQYWRKLITECEEYSLTGNIRKIKSTLQELILIPSRRAKIGNLLRVSYHSKIKMLLTNKGYKKAEAVIYAYLDIFGLDREIGILKNHFETLSGQKLALEDEATLQRDRDSWIDSEFIVNKKYISTNSSKE